MKVIFDKHADAVKAARNALKDGYNTAIRAIKGPDGKETFINEYFRRESERFHD